MKTSVSNNQTSTVATSCSLTSSLRLPFSVNLSQSTNVVTSIASSVPSNLLNAQPQGATKSKFKKSSQETLFSPETAENEALKIELSNARTKVVELKSKIIDKSLLIYKE